MPQSYHHQFIISTYHSKLAFAKIIPIIHKTGPADNPDNYSPISVLLTLSKILERAVHSQLTSFIEDRRLLSKFQFGYWKVGSELAITLLMDEIRRGIDDKGLFGAVFIDLRKEYDTISHSV